MESTKIFPDIQKGIAELCAQQPLLLPITDAIHKQGGISYLVGGAVRDLLLSLPIKDMDIEVHGMSLEALETVLKHYGPVSEVGKSFGVLKVYGTSFDFSLPRRDSAGRKPQVTIQDLSLEDALRRRDLTMNAMALDMHTRCLYDPFDGLSDLHAKRLRSPDSSFFAQDPLRFFRVMQFIGRFEMNPDEELTRICSSMDISDVSRERIEMEFEKLLLKSRRPSLGIR
jgi:tRNA nucleotidyltransferase (CCA-adding enzyme)